MFTAFIATVTAAGTVAFIAATPIVRGAAVIAAENMLAYLVVLPVKWTLEGIHKLAHRSA